MSNIERSIRLLNEEISEHTKERDDGILAELADARNKLIGLYQIRHRLILATFDGPKGPLQSLN